MYNMLLYTCFLSLFGPQENTETETQETEQLVKDQ